MNAADALAAAVFALRRVVALAEDYADDDAVYGLEQASQAAADALDALAAAGYPTLTGQA
jgi:hypothetical protein